MDWNFERFFSFYIFFKKGTKNYAYTIIHIQEYIVIFCFVKKRFSNKIFYVVLLHRTWLNSHFCIANTTIIKIMSPTIIQQTWQKGLRFRPFLRWKVKRKINETYKIIMEQNSCLTMFENRKPWSSNVSPYRIL